MAFCCSDLSLLKTQILGSLSPPYWSDHKIIYHYQIIILYQMIPKKFRPLHDTSRNYFSVPFSFIHSTNLRTHMSCKHLSADSEICSLVSEEIVEHIIFSVKTIVIAPFPLSMILKIVIANEVIPLRISVSGKCILSATLLTKSTTKTLTL